MAGLVNTFGAGAMTNSIGEIRDAEFLFVIGSNTSEAHPIIAMEMKRAVRRGATLVVADPRAIWMTKIAERHLQIKPGSDVWLINAMAQVIIAEGLCDEEFIEKNTEGFEEVKAKVASYTPERAEEACGVSAEDIRWAARRYATTERAGIYYTLGITEHSHGTDNVYALSNLVLMTGHLGKASSGLNPLRGQNNVQGANDAGASPVFYPGYQRVDDPAARRRFEEAWGVALSKDPGLNLNQMMKGMGTKIKGLFVMGEDILMSEPNVVRLQNALHHIDFMVVQDAFYNETARHADVIFPSSVYAEKDGVFTNSERRVQLVRKAIEPPGLARADWEILLDLAAACGAPWERHSASEIYDEMAALAPKFSGISHARLEESAQLHPSGIQWPCPEAEHPGTRYLHAGGVMRGRALFEAVDFRPAKELPDEDFPLSLSTGRTLYHYNSATQTREAPGLGEKQPEAWVEIHPKDARRRGIDADDYVEVSSPRGRIEVRALISRQVRPGCIWIPFHFTEARANVITNDEGDPVTGTAEYKVCAAQVSLVEKTGETEAIFPGNDYQI